MTPPLLSSATAPARPDVVYPESDGRPMGETGFHVEALFLLHQGLKSHLAATGRTDSYVAADMFFYYEEGNPKANKAPDVMVILGVGPHQRRTFKTWVESAIPNVIIEIASDETWREGLYHKRELYARLGVPEYFLFDPLGDCLDPRLQGFRLEEGVYVPLAPDADGGLDCRQLGLRLVPEGGMLRLIDARTGAPVLTDEEKAERLEQSRVKLERERRRAERETQRAKRQAQRAEREKQRAELQAQRAEQEKQRAELQAQRAEQEKQRAELQEQRAEQEKQRAEQETQRAEQQKQRAELEKQRAEQEKQRAEQETQRADLLADEVARLRALLAERRNEIG